MRSRGGDVIVSTTNLRPAVHLAKEVGLQVMTELVILEIFTGTQHPQRARRSRSPPGYMRRASRTAKEAAKDRAARTGGRSGGESHGELEAQIPTDRELQKESTEWPSDKTQPPGGEREGQARGARRIHQCGKSPYARATGSERGRTSSSRR